MHDVIIIGGGPAGMASAITLAAEGRKVLLLEAQEQLGGQIGTTTAVETFLTQLNITGADFADSGCKQCVKFGVEIIYNAPVRSIMSLTSSFLVYTGGRDLSVHPAKAVIIAVGLFPKRLGVPGEDLAGIFHGMKLGVLECPSENAHVVLVGGGNNVGQAAVHYLKAGSHVTIIARRPIAETMDKFLVDRIAGKAVVIQADVTGFSQTDNPYRLVVHLREGWGTSTIENIDCIHVMIGQEPHTGWLKGVLRRDGEGYIYTSKSHATSTEGIFAIGDVRVGVVHRALSAAGSGVEVVPAIHRYLDSLTDVSDMPTISTPTVLMPAPGRIASTHPNMQRIKRQNQF